MGINKKIIDKLNIKTENDLKMQKVLRELLHYESLGKGWWKDDYKKIIKDSAKEDSYEDKKDNT